jgi:hypothetical protein
VPGVNIGYVMLSMALVSLSNVVHFLLRGVKNIKGLRNIILLMYSTTVYIYEAAYGIKTIHRGTHIIDKFTLMTLILVLFGAGLSRAWELTGMHNKV